MALSNLTKVQTVGIGSNIEVVGVVTTGQFKSGTSNLHSTGVELTNLNVSGIATIGGNLSIGGTLTYEDVTNIDSIGIITARAGVNVSGGQLDVGSNIKIGNAGVITATSFVGSGANLTSLPAQATIANNADNRLITGGSGVNLNGEANLTFDGTGLLTQSGSGTASIMRVETTANDGDALIQADGRDSSGNLRRIMMRTDAGADQYRIISSDTSYNLALCTGNAPRVLIAGNSAATSIGGSNVFNAMLTVQGDISGQLLNLKATENTTRLMVSGTDGNGVEMNFYDDAGAQKGIIAASTNNFALKSTQDVTMQFMTNDGYGTVERAALDKHGIFKAHGFRRNRGNVGYAYNNLRNGYMGDDWQLGPGAFYYVGHKSSSSSSNYSNHELTIYRSGHWGQYPEVIIYAYMYYYQAGYRMFHINDSGTITQKQNFTSGGEPSISSGGQQLVGSGTNGGQDVHKYQITFTNGGTYQQVKWFVGFIGGGSAGHVGNSKTVAQADSHFAVNGGGLHFPNLPHAEMQGSPYYQF